VVITSFAALDRYQFGDRGISRGPLQREQLRTLQEL